MLFHEIYGTYYRTVEKILTLALQNCRKAGWVKHKSKLSLLWSGAGVLVLTVSLQPYAAAFLFAFLAIKVLMLVKWQ